MPPEAARETTIPSAQPAHPAARERQQLARRLLREASLELARLRRIRGAYRKTWRRVTRARTRLACAAALLTVAAAEPATAGTPIFASQLIPTSGPPPTFADIDGDGDLDAFVGDQHGNTILFENRRSGGLPAFTPPVTNPFGLASTGNGAVSPTFADIDGDGDLDAFRNTSFFANTGTASAPAFATFSANAFGLADVGGASPTFADLDGDGDLDAFIGDYYGNFENTGTASAPAFAAPTSDPSGLPPRPVFADVDGDGDLDAVAHSFGCGFYGCSSLLHFVENTGTASAPAFAAPASNAVGLPGQAALADIDGDGDLDAFARVLGTTLFFLNTGIASAPAFAHSANPFGLAAVGKRATPTFADLDDDGDLDAFVGRDNPGNTYFFANTGTASSPAFATFSANPFGLADVGYSASPTLADLDGDGDLDAFIAEYYGSTIVFANTGTAGAPAFAAPVTNPFGLANGGLFASPAFADLDGDGDLDYLVGDASGNTRLFENTGTADAPAFAAPFANPFGLAGVGAGAEPEFVDIDGDGDLDVFVGDYFGTTVLFENTGTTSAPAFAAPATNPFGLADVGAVASPAFADIDDDGDLDAFVGSSEGSTVFFENLEIGPGACSDGFDNDSDGDADFPADPGCADPEDTSERGAAFCDNGVDDDGDTRPDYPADPGCESPSDASELSSDVCDNGSDDDGDGLIDFPADPGCESLADSSERGVAVCDNGTDDDGDGLTDFPADLDCQGPQDDSEWSVLGPGCASSQLHALAGLCSVQLRCHAQDVKRPNANRLEQCLSEAESRFSSTLAKRAVARVKHGEVCSTDQASAIASDLEAFTLDLATDVGAGADLLDRSDAALRAAITRRAGVLCKADLRTLGREIDEPSADGGGAALLADRERFLRSTTKAIQKAERGGVSYDGLAPDEIAGALRALAEELTDQLSP